jgi:hypothetical protein
MPIITIHNAQTGEIEIREMNAAELTQLEIDKANAELRATDKAQASDNKAALLARLGLTADEAKLLLS